MQNEEIETLEPERDVESDSSLAAVIDRVLDKGLVINADITVSVSGTELLGIKIRAALASFETAAQYGLQFPSGTNMQTAAWNEAMVGKEGCPQCFKKVDTEQLLNKNCPWCGWQSVKAKEILAQKPTI
ncbi:MAG: gas vesicle protein [Nanoarchaeota archaeon]|nr:gas vesicle protein [Nanoarchaeota archaeon]